MDKVFLTYDDVEKSIDKMAIQITSSGYLPDVLISIGRGGMIPTRMLSDRLGITNVMMLPASSYTGIGTKIAPTIGTLPRTIFHEDVLLIDDILDSGSTIAAVKKAIQPNSPCGVLTATIYCKSSNNLRASFYDRLCDDDEWIVFPWETVENKNNYQ
jgi:hypoxanthine phosphoribosyltransferase